MDYSISFGMAVLGLTLAFLAHLKSKSADMTMAEAKRILARSAEMRMMAVERISETSHHVLGIGDLKDFVPK